MSDRASGMLVLAAAALAVAGALVVAGVGWALLATAAVLVVLAVAARDRETAE